MSSNTLEISPGDPFAFRNEPVFTYTVALPTANKTTVLVTPVVNHSSLIRAPGKKRAFKQAVVRIATSVLVGISALITALSPRVSTPTQPEIYLNGQLENVSLYSGSPQVRKN